MKQKSVWIVLNYNRFFCSAFTRRDAIREAERLCGVSWKEMSEYMRVARFEVAEVKK